MDLEVFFQSAFERIRNSDGRPLDISDALPLLCSIIQLKDMEDSDDDKFGFLGESITHSAIKFVFVRHYPDLTTADYDVFSKKFISLSRLHKAIDNEIHLVKEYYVYASQLSDILNSIMGILCSFYGIDVVAKFIEPAVLYVINSGASEAMASPLYVLRKLITDQNGFFADTAFPVDNGLWRVELKCKMTNRSTLFSHARNGTDMKMAKRAVAVDILNYLKHSSEELYGPPSPLGLCFKLPIDSTTQSLATHTNSSSSSLVKVKEEEEHKQSFEELYWTLTAKYSVNKRNNAVNKRNSRLDKRLLKTNRFIQRFSNEKGNA